VLWNPNSGVYRILGSKVPGFRGFKVLRFIGIKVSESGSFKTSLETGFRDFMVFWFLVLGFRDFKESSIRLKFREFWFSGIKISEFRSARVLRFQGF
jgi:hypothetical protein